ncbi:hypothetical protein C5688_14320 [Methylocystis sp. MitZ-2018]|nr:hypothetical protein C5688_14320 [Methylocystis sp. MitZ-2018]
MGTISADSRSSYFVTGADDGSAKVWRLPTGEEICGDSRSDENRLQFIQPIVTFEGHKARVSRALFSVDGRHVFTSSQDGTVRRWQVLDEDTIELRVPHTEAKDADSPFDSDNIKNAILSGNGKYFFIGKRAFLLENGEEKEIDSRVRMIAPGRAGASAVIFDASMKSYSFPKGNLDDSLEDSDSVGYDYGAFASPDGSRFVSASQGEVSVLSLYRSDDRKLLTHLEHNKKPATKLFFSPDSSRLFGRMDRDDGSGLLVWDVRSGNLLVSYDDLEDCPGDARL